MTHTNIEDIYPQSPIQEAIFSQSLQAEGATVHIIQLVSKLRGSLNVHAFEQAWEYVIDRHSILRTLFTMTRQKKNIQVVCRRVTSGCGLIVWSELSDREQRASLETYLRDDRERGFDLSRPPLMRHRLVRLSENEYYFIWSFHHLLLDRWSLSLILQEVLSIYEAFGRGGSVELEEPGSYGEYIGWLQRQDFSQPEAFWLGQLKGTGGATSLKPQTQTRRGALAQTDKADHILLSEGLTARLQWLARHHRLTLSSFVQTAWALLLSHYSGSKDVIFGTVVSGRSVGVPRIGSTAGLFLNVLPTRLQISDDESLLQLLNRVQARQIEMCQYDYCSMAQIQKWSELPRGAQLFNSVVDIVNYPVRAAAESIDGSLQSTETQSVERVSHPISLLAVPGQRLKMELSYDQREFSDIEIALMLGHLQSLMECIDRDLDSRISELPLFACAARRLAVC